MGKGANMARTSKGDVNMKSWVWLRIAAVVTLLYCAGHTMGMPWTPATGPQEVAVLNAMKAIRFEAMGANRTYWDFYFGFGVAIAVYLLVQAAVLWQLAGIERRMPGSTRLIIAAFCISFVVNAIVVWKYFFAVPLVMAVAIAICLAVAFQLSPRE
jgi:hypothetical protein